MKKNKNTYRKIIKNNEGKIIGYVRKLWFREFLRKVYDIYGLYLDSTFGFISINKHITELQKKICSNNKIRIEDFDKKNFSYGRGKPGSKDSYIMHISEIREVKERNKNEGENYKNIANLCLVLIYQYWENYYRKRIANDIGCKKNDLKLDIFGEIRIIRESIIHHRSIALEKVEEFKLLKWFKKGDKIEIDSKKFERIIYYIFYSIYNNISEEYKKYESITIKSSKNI